MQRRTKKCLDCGYPLEKIYNFCPHCGQENRDQQVSIFTLAGDFLSNYFSLDSKFSKSLKHFFLKPGQLTTSFNEGKRVRYIHPLRLYLVISFLFFFILNLLITLKFQDLSINSMGSAGNGRWQAPDRTEPGQVNAGLQALPVATDPVSGRPGGFEQGISWMRDESLSDEAVMDLFEVEEETRKNGAFQMAFHQLRKVTQKELDVFLPYVLKNLPVMMFLLLPVFAFYLKLFFKEPSRLYIRHLIHALHIHSMAFLLLCLFLLTGWISGSYFFFITFLLITLYAFISVKKVYQKSWGKTIFRFLLLGGFHFFTLFLFIALEMLWSFLTF